MLEGPAGGLVVGGGGEHRRRVIIGQPAAVTSGRGPDWQRLAVGFVGRGLRGGGGGGRIASGQRQPGQRRQQRVPLWHVLADAGIQARREHGHRVTWAARPLGGQRARYQQVVRGLPLLGSVEHRARCGCQVLVHGVPIVAVPGNQRDPPMPEDRIHEVLARHSGGCFQNGERVIPLPDLDVVRRGNHVDRREPGCPGPLA